jgi:hypothetical protein
MSRKAKSSGGARERAPAGIVKDRYPRLDDRVKRPFVRGLSEPGNITAHEHERSVEQEIAWKREQERRARIEIGTSKRRTRLTGSYAPEEATALARQQLGKDATREQIIRVRNEMLRPENIHNTLRELNRKF